ncbi:MAG: flagellar basal body rod protein FlgC [Hyphomonadaceae bacterium]|jgi:flagellar basal-body rod protein FlgC|nr:flagellar basal body rod protein FlgC [Hyphomonadaceae bacterium]
MSSDPLHVASKIGASGLQAQSLRLRVIAENMANAYSTGRTPGSNPYTRKVVSFESQVDEVARANMVTVAGIERARAPYRMEHMPGHPAADAQGFVRLPNVDLTVEAADMREANRSYQANLQMIKRVNEIESMMLDMLRTS